LEAFC